MTTTLIQTRITGKTMCYDRSVDHTNNTEKLYFTYCDVRPSKNTIVIFKLKTIK